VSESSRPATRGHGIALAVIVTCQLMLVLDVTVVNVALVPIQRSLHFSTVGLSWVLDTYILTFGGLLLLGGRAGDIFGRRRMLVVGLSVFTLASLAGGLATSPAWLLTARAIQGVGAALAAPSTLSLISATFEEGPSRLKALALYSGVSAAGGSLGLVLGGALTSWVSWRWCLFINVPIGLAVVVLAPRFVTEPPRNRGRLDFAGAILVTAGLTGVIFSLIRYAQGVGAGIPIASLAAGVILIAGFVLVEQHREQPLMSMSLLTDRLRGPAYLTMFVMPAVMNGMFFFISQYMERDLRFSAVKTGVAFLPLTGLIVIGSRLTPRFVHRFGARPLLIFGLVCVTAGSVWISRATVSSGYVSGLLAPLIVFGFGAGACFLPLNVTIMAGVPHGDAGVAAGMLQTMQQGGSAFGIAALTSIAASHGQSDALLIGGIAASGVLLLSIFGPWPLRAVPDTEELDAELVPVALADPGL
jgi:EmrB/QacA subfamily drug resistance transporter